VKIFVAVPNMGQIATDLVMRLMEWMAEGPPIVLYAPQNVIPPHRVRNLCHKAFLESDCSHLFIVDGDTIPPPNALRQLLEDRKPLVSAVVQAWKEGGPMAVAFRWNEALGGYAPHYGNGVEKVDIATLACCMIERDVMEKVGPRAFSWEDTDEWGTEGYSNTFVFCRRLGRLQIPIHVDYRLLCGHRKTVDLAEVNALLVGDRDG